jgi:hypothetical protein
MNGAGVESIPALDAWARSHFVYRFESEEVIRTVPFMVDELRSYGRFSGDCDDAATMIAAVLLAMGRRARFEAIRTDPDNTEFLHVFVSVEGVRGWEPVDPTVHEGTIYQDFGRMTVHV